MITHTHTPLLVKRVNWGYLYMPIQMGTFECGYTPAYWGYTKYECDYTPITWGYHNAPSIGDMLLNAFIWHFRSHAGNAQMGTSPVGSVSTFPLAESDVCPRFTPFTNAPHTPHTHTHTHPLPHKIQDWSYLVARFITCDHNSSDEHVHPTILLTDFVIGTACALWPDPAVTSMELRVLRSS